MIIIIAAKIFLRIHYVLGIEVNILHLLTHFILTITLGGRHYNYARFTDENTKANKEKLSNFSLSVSQ